MLSPKKSIILPKKVDDITNLSMADFIHVYCGFRFFGQKTDVFRKNSSKSQKIVKQQPKPEKN